MLNQLKIITPRFLSIGRRRGGSRRISIIHPNVVSMAGSINLGYSHPHPITPRLVKLLNLIFEFSPSIRIHESNVLSRGLGIRVINPRRIKLHQNRESAEGGGLGAVVKGNFSALGPI